MKIREMAEKALGSWAAFCEFLSEAKNVLAGLRSKEELRAVTRDEGSLYLFADLHGDIKGVAKLEEICDRMDEDETICLGSLGDIVAAEGQKQLEALALFLSALIKFPERVFICKGNCETDSTILTAEGLATQTHDRWGMRPFLEVVDRILEVTNLLPAWLSFSQMDMLVVHGGPIRPVESLDSLILPIPQLDQWGDFDENVGFSTPVGPRGVDFSRVFGPDRVRHLLEVTRYSVLLRGHQSKMLKTAKRGLVFSCDGQMATFHSCHKAPTRHLFVADMGTVIDRLGEEHFIEF